MALPELGVKLRALRKSKGLKLSEVARAVGLTPGYLSQLEGGKVGASFATLVKLTEYYGQKLSELLRSVENREHPILVRAQGGVTIVRNEQYSVEWLVARPDCLIEVDLMTIQPGGSSGGNYAHEGEEFCFVLEGSVKVAVGSEEYLLSKGDLLYFKSDVPHSWCNPGECETRVLWCSTPPM